MMNESNLLGFCFKALINNTISCLKIHIMEALSPVHLIATVYFEMILKSRRREYQPVLYNSADTRVIT